MDDEQRLDKALDRYKVKPSRSRVAYFTPEVEDEIYTKGGEALALVVRASILTGARPFSEVCGVESRHVEELDGRQTWRFPPEEHKTGHSTGKDRVVFVPEEVAKIVRRLIKEHPTGKLFRVRGEPWEYTKLKDAFGRLRKKIDGLGPDDTIYAARHTYCKRLLGKGVSMEKVSKLMGNSLAVCQRHYGQWDSRHV